MATCARWPSGGGGGAGASGGGGGGRISSGILETGRRRPWKGRSGEGVVLAQSPRIFNGIRPAAARLVGRFQAAFSDRAGAERSHAFARGTRADGPRRSSP